MGNYNLNFLKILMGKYLVDIVLTGFFVFMLSSCATQQTATAIENVAYDLEVNNKAFEIDELGFLYVVTKRNELIRYDSNVQQEFAYSNERLGSISSVDVNNPFKLLTFYENYQTIIVLDNLLGEIGRYELFDLGFNNIEAVGLSNDNNVWIYDPIEYKLKKLDNAGAVLAESITLYNEGLEYIKPHFLAEKENKVFLYDRENGFFVFDNLGQYIEQIKIKNLNSFQILSKDRIIYLQDKQLSSYDLVYKSAEIIRPITDFTSSKVSDCLISKDLIYLRNEEGIIWKKLLND